MHQLIPSVVYIASAIMYFHQSLRQLDASEKDESTDRRIVAEKILAACTLVLLIYTQHTEYKQLRQIMNEKKTCKYFKSIWNWIDITSNLSTLLIITVTILELEWIPMKTLTLLAAVTSCLLVGKLADWLRLFETTSFYVQLVS